MTFIVLSWFLIHEAFFYFGMVSILLFLHLLSSATDKGRLERDNYLRQKK